MFPQDVADQPDPSPKRRSRVVTTVAGLGLAATAILAVPAIASAQDESAPETTTTVEPSTPQDEGSAPMERGDHLDEVLAPLVEDGTLTQQQADAVIERLREAHESSDRDGPVGHRFGPPGARMDFLDDTVTDLLDISFEELIQQLRGGASLAEVAEANGVDPQILIDAMVDAAQEKIDESVASGEITESEAAERSAKASEHITERVNGEIADHPGRGFGPPHRMFDGGEDDGEPGDS